MSGAGTDSCTVTLNAAAATGGLAVGLASNNTAVTVPASVTVAAGATTAGFTATVAAVSSAQTVTLTASAGTVTKTFTLQLSAPSPTLTLNASSISFGNVNLNTPTTQTVTLSSSGGASVTINSVTISGTGFTFSGATFPLTLTSPGSVTLSIQFDPTTAGSVTGQLTVNSTSSTNPTATVALSGMGVAASYSVSLSWSAPTSSPDPVAGYNIYRSPSGGSSYQLMGSVSSTELIYSDTNSIQNGQTYDYIVESVDASGVDSVASNTATVSIP
ncbi:MAG TPA: choice-of-anchor D domain-containing protein [Terracidiphilus sp.]|jgi:hypothetical protein